MCVLTSVYIYNSTFIVYERVLHSNLCICQYLHLSYFMGENVYCCSESKDILMNKVEHNRKCLVPSSFLAGCDKLGGS